MIITFLPQYQFKKSKKKENKDVFLSDPPFIEWYV